MGLKCEVWTEDQSYDEETPQTKLIAAFGYLSDASEWAVELSQHLTQNVVLRSFLCGAAQTWRYRNGTLKGDATVI